MLILPEPIAFIWDEGNAYKNYEKHKVTAEEAEEMFLAEPYIVEDVVHSTILEYRFHALGTTRDGRKLFASYTVRNGKIRVISIRDMNKKEKQAYEKLEKNP